MLNLNIFTLFLFLGCSLVASATVTPSEYQVQQLSKKRASFSQAYVSSLILKGQASEESKTGSPHEKALFRDQTWVDWQKRELVSRAVNSEGRLLFFLRRSLGEQIERPENKKESKVVELPLYRPKDLGVVGPTLNHILFDNQAETLLVSLLNAGIAIRQQPELLQLSNEAVRRAVERIRPQRWKEEVAWVTLAEVEVGFPILRDWAEAEWKKKLSAEPSLSAPPKTSDSQTNSYPVLQPMSYLPKSFNLKAISNASLWLKEHELTPVRLIGDAYEVHFNRYTYHRGLSYPREIILLKEDRPTLLASMERIEVVRVGESKPEQMKIPPLPASAKESGLTVLGKELDQESGGVLSTYYRWVR